MEEREPPDNYQEPFPPKNTSPDHNNNNNSNNNNNNDDTNFYEYPFPQPPGLAVFRSGMYVVQVPKDQVYRVPPPENAALAARNRNSLPKQNRCCYSCCCRVFLPVIIILLILAILGCIAFVLLKHEKPIFQIDHFLLKNKNKNKNQNPEYDITVKAKNPNRITSIYYYKGFDVSLSFKKKEIAVGDYPGFNQGPEDSTMVKIALHGSDIVLPREIERSLNGTKSKTHISLSLSMNVPVRMKVGLVKTGSKNVAVLCNLKLDTLAKKTRVISQTCQSSG